MAVGVRITADGADAPLVESAAQPAPMMPSRMAAHSTIGLRTTAVLPSTLYPPCRSIRTPAFRSFPAL